jgi:hypothetical protein
MRVEKPIRIKVIGIIAAQALVVIRHGVPYGYLYQLR